jgi:hypothetical protein
MGEGEVMLLRAGALAIVMIVAQPVAATAQDESVVSVSELLADGRAFAGATVTLEGELVGDYGFRRDGTMWTQLNDDAYARDPMVESGRRAGSNIGVGVSMPASLADGLDPPGGYRRKGPLVQLTGTWRFHDPDRGGESYLEVRSLIVVEPGRHVDEKVNWAVLLSGLVVAGLAAGLWLVRRRAER